MRKIQKFTKAVLLLCIASMFLAVSAAAEDGESMFEYIKNGGTAEEISTEDTFADVNGSEWFGEYLPIPVEHDVVSGYDDGTFQPDKYVTAGEAVKMVASAFEPDIDVNYTNDLDDGTSQWFGKYYKACSQAFPYDYSVYMDSDYLSSHEITRAEFAYFIAKYISFGTTELDQYIDAVEEGTMGSLEYFPDVTRIYFTESIFEQEMEIIKSGGVPARFAGALSYLLDKEIFSGYPDGTLRPLNPIRRSEMLILIDKTCRNTKSYSEGQFSNPNEGSNVLVGPNAPQGSEEDDEEQEPTILEYAQMNGYSYDQFLIENALPMDLSPDTPASVALDMVPLYVVADLEGITYDELVEELGLSPGQVSETTSWGDALGELPLDVYVGEDIDEFLDFFELDGIADGQTKWKEVRDIVENFDYEARSHELESEHDENISYDENGEIVPGEHTGYSVDDAGSVVAGGYTDYFEDEDGNIVEYYVDEKGNITEYR